MDRLHGNMIDLSCLHGDRGFALDFEVHRTFEDIDKFFPGVKMFRHIDPGCTFDTEDDGFFPRDVCHIGFQQGCTLDRLGLGDQDVGADDADGDPNAQGEGEHDSCAVHRGSLATGSFRVISAAEICIVSLKASLVHYCMIAKAHVPLHHAAWSVPSTP
jgi:hypothetical protein